MSSAVASFKPIAASTGESVRLAMQRLWLTGRVMAAGARLVVQHVFRSDEERPLEVIYSFPLPRDAALRGFRITGDGFEAHSELKATEEAVRAYERGVADGSLSTLARQYGDGLVNLTVGNVRPKETVKVYLEILTGVEMRDDGFRFRFPFTLAPAYHARMRAAVAGAQGEMELPADEFGDVILPPFREDAGSLHEVGFELSVLHGLPLEEVGSPSHSVKVMGGAVGSTRVALAPAKDVPNRDLVVDARYQATQVQALSGPSGDGKRSFALIVPSTMFGRNEEKPRRTAILLDRSGSMQGEPIAQARKAIEACLAALSEKDSFSLMAFDNNVEAMGGGVAPATREQREAARAFLKRVDARGGTELAAGVTEAARALGGGGDILIITDGQVFGTEAILAQARATGIRLFCLGIGSASQDRFLALLARETGGIGRFVTARERVDLAAVDLFASMGRPVATGLKADNAQPEPPEVVFAGTPVLLFGDSDQTAETGDSSGAVSLTWDGGAMRLDVPEGDAETGETVRLLRGSRLITDWESRYPAGEATGPVAARRQSRVAARLAELSATYGLASREMSLVAVVKRQGDRPGELPETRVVPVGMAQDTAFDAYFGDTSRMACQVASTAMPLQMDYSSAAKKRSGKRWFALGRSASRMAESALMREAEPTVLELAALLEPDGGMPGDNLGVRIARSIAAVLAFAAEGHTVADGAFRLHMSRLVGFLRSVSVSSDKEKLLLERALEAALTGRVPSGRWLALALSARTGWKQVGKALSL
ncbi:MAG: VWA domain-containing protein [Bryobacteraceae bacterium]|nr:VWA domain-containing protein [Bryobacteraceae bacterium]